MITIVALGGMVMLNAGDLGAIKILTARGVTVEMVTAIAIGGTEITVVRAGETTGRSENSTAVLIMGAILIAIAVRARAVGATGTAVKTTVGLDGMIGMTTVATAAMTDAQGTKKMMTADRPKCGRFGQMSVRHNQGNAERQSGFTKGLQVSLYQSLEIQWASHWERCQRVV